MEHLSASTADKAPQVWRPTEIDEDGRVDSFKESSAEGLEVRFGQEFGHSGYAGMPELYSNLPLVDKITDKEAVFVEPTPTVETGSTRIYICGLRRRTFFEICAVFLVLVIIAVVVGGVMASKKKTVASLPTPPASVSPTASDDNNNATRTDSGGSSTGTDGTSGNGSTIESGPLRGIAAGSAMATVTYTNGTHRLFFQNTSGDIRMYSCDAKAKNVTCDVQIQKTAIKDAKPLTPLAATTGAIDVDHNIAIFYTNKNNTPSAAVISSLDGSLVTTGLEASTLSKFSIDDPYDKTNLAAVSSQSGESFTVYYQDNAGIIQQLICEVSASESSSCALSAPVSDDNTAPVLGTKIVTYSLESLNSSTLDIRVFYERSDKTLQQWYEKPGTTKVIGAAPHAALEDHAGLTAFSFQNASLDFVSTRLYSPNSHNTIGEMSFYHTTQGWSTTFENQVLLGSSHGAGPIVNDTTDAIAVAGWYVHEEAALHVRLYYQGAGDDVGKTISVASWDDDGVRGSDGEPHWQSLDGGIAV